MRMYYQPKGGKKGKYALRENTYRRVWYLIADYKYFKCVQAGMAESEALRSGKGTGYVAEDPAQGFTVTTGVKAEAPGFDMEQLERYIQAIEDAQKKVPEAYVGYIMEHITNRMKYRNMEGVSERTIKMWVQRFIWTVAHNLGEV